MVLEWGGKRNERALINDGGLLRSRDGEGGKKTRGQRPGKCSALMESMEEEGAC